MEVTFTELKQKDVINTVDGRHLGKVCDVLFTFPESKVQGFTVTGCKGFRFSKQELFLPVKSVIKIGKDAILVNFGKEEDECPPPKDDCRPQKCPPPPKRDCPPPYSAPPSRRSFEEYE